MRTIYILLALTIMLFPATGKTQTLPAQPASDIQSCNSNEECVMVPSTCDHACGTIPMNRAHSDPYLQQHQQRCGVAVENLPVCTMHPPLQAICMNQRCTIDYAHQHNSHEGDYINGGQQGPPQR